MLRANLKTTTIDTLKNLIFKPIKSYMITSSKGDSVMMFSFWVPSLGIRT